MKLHTLFTLALAMGTLALTTGCDDMLAPEGCTLIETSEGFEGCEEDLRDEELDAPNNSLDAPGTSTLDGYTKIGPSGQSTICKHSPHWSNRPLPLYDASETNGCAIQADTVTCTVTSVDECAQIANDLRDIGATHFSYAASAQHCTVGGAHCGEASNQHSWSGGTRYEFYQLDTPMPSMSDALAALNLPASQEAVYLIKQHKTHTIIEAELYQGGSSGLVCSANDFSTLEDCATVPGVLGSKTNKPFVVYQVYSETDGIFSVSFRYAAGFPRPMTLSVNPSNCQVNGQELNCDGHNTMTVMKGHTGGWGTDHQTRVMPFDGNINLSKGLNTLVLSGSQNMTHLDKIVLTRIDHEQANSYDEAITGVPYCEKDSDGVLSAPQSDVCRYVSTEAECHMLGSNRFFVDDRCLWEMVFPDEHRLGILHSWSDLASRWESWEQKYSCGYQRGTTYYNGPNQQDVHYQTGIQSVPGELIEKNGEQYCSHPPHEKEIETRYLCGEEDFLGWTCLETWRMVSIRGHIY